jgi:hypothetical protein bacD2_02365
MKDLAKMCLTAIISLLAVIVCCFICSSCRSVQYVPVETVHNKVEYRDRLQRDSIHVYDSIFMYHKGDTVFRDRWHTEYKDRLVRDTSYINLTDTISVPYPVEKELSRWQQMKIELGGWAFGVITAFALVMIGCVVYRLRRK